MKTLLFSLALVLTLNYAQSEEGDTDRLSTFCFLDSERLLMISKTTQQEANFEIRRIGSGEVLSQRKTKSLKGRLACAGNDIFWWNNDFARQFHLEGNEIVEDTIHSLLKTDPKISDRTFLYNHEALSQNTVYAIIGDWSHGGRNYYYKYNVKTKEADRLFEPPVTVADSLGVRYYASGSSSKFSHGQVLIIGSHKKVPGKFQVSIHNEKTGKVMLLSDLPLEVPSTQFYDAPGVLFLPLSYEFITVADDELHVYDYRSGQTKLKKVVNVGDNGLGARSLSMTEDKKYYVIAGGGAVKIARVEDGAVIYQSPTYCPQNSPFGSSGHIFFTPDQQWIGVNFADCSYLISRKHLDKQL